MTDAKRRPHDGHQHCEAVQHHQVLGIIEPDGGGGKDVFVHISAVERSGLTGLKNNQKVSLDIESGRDGRDSASNPKLA